MMCGQGSACWYLLLPTTCSSSRRTGTGGAVGGLTAAAVVGRQQEHGGVARVRYEAPAQLYNLFIHPYLAVNVLSDDAAVTRGF